MHLHLNEQTLDDYSCSQCESLDLLSRLDAIIKTEKEFMDNEERFGDFVLLQ